MEWHVLIGSAKPSNPPPLPPSLLGDLLMGASEWPIASSRCLHLTSKHSAARPEACGALLVSLLVEVETGQWHAVM